MTTVNLIDNAAIDAHVAINIITTIPLLVINKNEHIVTEFGIVDILNAEEY